jgi:hypothetical protein
VDLATAITQAVVVHPGDNLVIGVHADVDPAQLKQLSDGISDQLDGVKVLVIAGAEAFAAVRGDAA